MYNLLCIIFLRLIICYRLFPPAQPFLMTNFTSTERGFFQDTVPTTVGKSYCLSFWYHMTGNDVGALYVHWPADASPGYDIRPVWSRVGNYSNRWLHGEVPFIGQGVETMVSNNYVGQKG
jgi:hypothetical protein